MICPAKQDESQRNKKEFRLWLKAYWDKYKASEDFSPMVVHLYAAFTAGYALRDIYNAQEEDRDAGEEG